MMTEKIKTEGKTEQVELVQRIVDTVPAYRTPEGHDLSFEEYMVWLGNLVYKISKAI